MQGGCTAWNSVGMALWTSHSSVVGTASKNTLRRISSHDKHPLTLKTYSRPRRSDYSPEPTSVSSAYGPFSPYSESFARVFSVEFAARAVSHDVSGFRRSLHAAVGWLSCVPRKFGVVPPALGGADQELPCTLHDAASQFDQLAPVLSPVDALIPIQSISKPASDRKTSVLQTLFDAFDFCLALSWRVCGDSAPCLLTSSVSALTLDSVKASPSSSVPSDPLGCSS